MCDQDTCPEGKEIEPHVHHPTNIVTINEFEKPENRGIRCGVCLMPMPMTEPEWREFINYWLFGRRLPDDL